MLELLYTAIINPTTVRNSKESKQIDNIWQLFKQSTFRSATNEDQMKKILTHYIQTWQADFYAEFTEENGEPFCKIVSYCTVLVTAE